MKPILPRPLLWTEIKTMDEFLNGDFLTSLLYDSFKRIVGTMDIPHISAVTFFNELYYQLTRYNYEKPEPEDYPRYYNDIKTHLGYVSYTNLVLTMMYHYCRLKDWHFRDFRSQFMLTIRENQMKKDFWQFFTRAISTVYRWPEIVPYPEKPCPVAPSDLAKRGMEWDKITNQYDLETIKEILNLWKNFEDKKAVADMIRWNMHGNQTIYNYSRKYDGVVRYLKQVVDKPHEDVVVSEKRNGNNSVYYTFSTKKKTDDVAEVLKKKDEEILQLKMEKDGYRRKLALFEKKNKELQQQHEEDEARMLAGFGSMIVEEQVNDKEVEYHVIDTDADIVMAESQKLDEMRQKQIEQMKKTSEKLEESIKELQEKLGNESVPLSVLAEGLKDYVDEAGIDEAHNLFNQLNNLLFEVTAWTKNVPELKKFFRQARTEMKKEKEKSITNIGQQTIFGNVGTYNDKIENQHNHFPAIQSGQEGQKRIES